MAELKQFKMQNALRSLALAGTATDRRLISRELLARNSFCCHGSLRCTWDGPTPRTVNAVRIWPQKDIVFKFPVLKNSRPRKRFIYGCVFSKPPWPDFLKKIIFDTVVQMLGKATNVMRQVQRSYKWPSCPFTLFNPSVNYRLSH